MTAQEHSKTLGILFLVYLGLQVLGVIIGLIFVVAFSGIILTNVNGNDAVPFAFIGIVFGVAMVISILLLIPIAFAGFKMFKEKSNAKIWGIIASIISLISFPIGTALGVYGLWFLLGEQGRQFYEGGQIASKYPPPPPNSWQ